MTTWTRAQIVDRLVTIADELRAVEQKSRERADKEATAHAEKYGQNSTDITYPVAFGAALAHADHAVRNLDDLITAIAPRKRRKKTTP